ncbi:MAG TPA: hypothetical protein VI337_01195, partial [Nitrospirales bacterium]|nr:hypothetical protein [Nitrospirales bacterium]
MARDGRRDARSAAVATSIGRTKIADTRAGAVADAVRAGARPGRAAHAAGSRSSAGDGHRSLGEERLGACVRSLGLTAPHITSSQRMISASKDHRPVV